MRVIEGFLKAKGLKFAIIVSRFNELITHRLENGALDALVRHGASEEDITVIRVPGAFEIPSAAQLAVASGRFDAVICIGAVIRGETPHFDYIAAETTKGIASVGMKAAIPVAFGVITADTMDQALDRAGAKAGNKGAEAALSAIEMANVYKELKG